MVQITNDRRKSYVEILEILKHMEPIYVNKIPKETIDFFENNKSDDYTFKYDASLALDQQNLNDNTLALLAMLNLNYWCDDEEKREQLRKHYEENEKKYQEILQVEFNPDTVFKKEQQNKEQTADSTSENQTILVEYKESGFKKFIKKIKDILHIK